MEAQEYITIVGLVLMLVLQIVLLFCLLLRKPQGINESKIERIVDEALYKTASRENKVLRDDIEHLRNSFMSSFGEFRIEQSSTLERKLNEMQSSNEKKLEDMRRTVDEKLEKTMETRLKQSFETVSNQLESVNKGLGEMRTVAESVGSLNKILSGTKTRGMLGEWQLGRIIEDILPSHQYDKEVPTFDGSSDRVEYAVKLPGQVEGDHVYLPVDSKFPLEDYYRLLERYEAGDASGIEESRKALFSQIKEFAKSVKSKYVSPPQTTAFAIIFLPTEGLFAEVIRDPAFFDGLRRDGIIITGPTTFSAMLNSLQVGFKTLQIQKEAARIEKILGLVKKEFENYEEVLTRASKRINDVGNEIDTLVGKRTRAINRTLRAVQIYEASANDTERLLGFESQDGNSE